MGRRFSADHRRGLGRRAGAARRSPGHPAMGGGHGRQPRRNAGARLGDALPGAHPPCTGDRGGAEPLGAEHRVQRGRAAGDPHRSRFSRWALRRSWDQAAARSHRRADDRPHHVFVRRADGLTLRPHTARRPQVLVRAGIPDRVLSSLPGREVRRVLRREHVSARHQGARLLRSGGGGGRRPRARALRRGVQVPRRIVHDRLAVRTAPLARDREGARRQPARRVLRGDRRRARPRCVPARRPAVHGCRSRVLRSHRRRNRSQRRLTASSPTVESAFGGQSSRPVLRPVRLASLRRRTFLRRPPLRAAPISRPSRRGSRGARASSTSVAAMEASSPIWAASAARPATASRSTMPACSRV